MYTLLKSPTQIIHIFGGYTQEQSMYMYIVNTKGKSQSEIPLMKTCVHYDYYKLCNDTWSPEYKVATLFSMFRERQLFCEMFQSTSFKVYEISTMNWIYNQNWEDQECTNVCIPKSTLPVIWLDVIWHTSSLIVIMC